jgi:hypothetical protein
MRISDYAHAKEHYEAALADENLEEDKAQLCRGRLARVEVFLEAADATARVIEAKKKRFQKRYDEALDIIEKLQGDYADNEKILRILQLDRLRRQIASDRTEYFAKQVRSRFYKALNELVRAKVRDKELSFKDVYSWAVNPKGLGQEIFAEITEETGLGEAEARELWQARTTSQPKHYNYGSGTYLHPEEAAKTRKALADAKKNQRSSSRGGGMRQRNPGGRGGQQQQERQKTPDEWWEAQSAKHKENWIKAYFAEYSGLLTVLRIKTTACTNCGGQGVTIANDLQSGEQVKHICQVCNLAGHERIVICR